MACLRGQHEDVNEGKKVLLVGLKDSGKTTILSTLKQGDDIKCIAKPGSTAEVATFQYNDVRFTIRNMDDLATLQNHWSSHLTSANAVIFVVDSSDRGGIEGSRKELENILTEATPNQCAGLIVLVFANMSDKENAMNKDEITDALHMHSYKNWNWYVDEIRGFSAESMIDSFDWLTNQLKEQ